jgi:pimeloyl-ACP methyl ester carboxylesterase
VSELSSKVALASVLALSGCGPILYPAPRSQAAPVVRGAELLRLGATPDECVALWSPPEPGRSVVVFFHGNATEVGDLGWLADDLRSEESGILFVEYPGYGVATGTPSETSIYRCAAQALDELPKLGVDEARTVLVGQSLGTAVAVEMTVRGYGSRLLLISPFSSIADLVDGLVPFGLGGVFVTDEFDTLSKARHIAIQTVVVQGDADWLVPFEMAQEVAGRIPGARLEVFAGAGHNDMFAHDDGRLLRLIRELAISPR